MEDTKTKPIKVPRPTVAGKRAIVAFLETYHAIFDRVCADIEGLEPELRATQVNYFRYNAHAGKAVLQMLQVAKSVKPIPTPTTRHK